MIANFPKQLPLFNDTLRFHSARYATQFRYEFAQLNDVAQNKYPKR